jgi:hypothetical protein
MRTVRCRREPGLATRYLYYHRRAWVVYTATAEPGTEAVALAAEIDARTRNWAFKLQVGRITTLSRDIAQLVTVPLQAPTPIGPNTPTPLFPAPP